MGRHHFESLICDNCNEYNHLLEKQCEFCHHSICNSCCSGTLERLTEAIVEQECRNRYMVRYEMMDFEDQPSEADMPEFKKTDEYNRLMENMDIGKDFSSHVCVTCEDNVVFKLEQLICNKLVTKDAFLLNKTEFKTISEAKLEHGTFEQFLASRAGFSDVYSALRAFATFEKQVRMTDSKTKIDSNIKDSANRFLVILMGLVKDEKIKAKQADEYWFLKSAKVKKFIHKRQSSVEQKDSKENQEKVIAKFATKMARRWELDIYFEPEKDHDYYINKFSESEIC